MIAFRNITLNLQIDQLFPHRKCLKVPDSTIDRFKCCRPDEHYIESQELGDTTPPVMCKFSKVNPHILAVADDDGGLLILNTRYQGLHAVKQDWLAHPNAIFDIDWMPGENKLLTGSGDKTVVLWDVEQEEKTAIFKGHRNSVKTTRFSLDNPWLFASGARDGNIMIYDCRVKAKDNFIPSINTIRNAHKPQSLGSGHKKKKSNVDSGQSVTSLVFLDEYSLISAANVDGCIHVWDLRKTYSMLKSDPVPKHTFRYGGTGTRSYGLSNLTLDGSRSRLFASCMDHTIYQYNTASCNSKPVCSYSGHKNGTFYIKSSLSPDDEFLLSGSSDNEAYIWRVSQPAAPPWRLQGHVGEVSAVDWCQTDVGKIATVSDDSTVRIWRVDVAARNDSTPCSGHVIGTTLRKVETGVTTRSVSAMKQTPVPLTPQKGTMIPPSPMKHSPSVARSLATLPTILAERPSTSPAPSTSWNRSTAMLPQPSPAKKTPKQLLITPQKIESPMKSADNSGCRTVKRKLYGENSPPESPTMERLRKRRRLDDGFFVGHVMDENSMDGAPTPLSPPTGSPRMSSPRVLARRLENPEKPVTPLKAYSSPRRGRMTSPSAITPMKPASSPRQYQSPTINLPNYVANPQPRTPVSRRKNEAETTPKTPNWLLQMRLQKHDLSGKDSGKVSSATKPGKRTPGSRKKQPESSSKRSIMKFFSPKVDKTSQPDQT